MAAPGPRLDPTAAIVLVGGVGVLALYTVRYPAPLAILVPDTAGLVHAAKLLAAARAGLVLGMLNLAAYGLGRWVHAGVQRCGGAGAEPPVLFGLAYGWIALAYLGLAVAAFGGLRPPVLALVVALPALHTFVRWLRSEGPRRLARTARRTPWGAIGLAAFALAPTLLDALGPYVGHDALTYHLALPERQLAAHGLFVTPFSIMSAFPAAMETLYVFALGLGNDAAAKLLHFEFGVLILWGLAWMGARLSPRCGWLAPFFLLGEPLLLEEMGWAYNDLMAAFYAVLAAGTLLAWRESGGRAPLLACSVFAGACVGTRYLGGIVAPCLAFALLFGRRERLLACVRAGAVLGIGSLLLLAPWLLRNWVFTGNPFAPLLQGVFQAPGEAYFEPVAMEQIVAFNREIGMGRSLSALLWLPWNVTLETVPGLYSGSFGYRIGPLPLLGTAAALGVLISRRDPRIAFLLGFVGCYVGVWFSTIQESRYLLPVLPILALVGAWAFDQLLGDPPGRRVWLLALPAYAVVICVLPGWAALPVRFELALGPTPAQRALELETPSAHAADFLRRRLGPGDRVLLVPEPRSYLFRGLDYVPWQPPEAPPVLQLVHRAGSVERLQCALSELGVTHVLFNTRLLPRVQPHEVDGYGLVEYRADMERIRKLLVTRSERIYQRSGVSVGRLRPAEACGDGA